MPTPDDTLTSALDRISSELRTFGGSYEDTCRLLAAVEAVLKLADESVPLDTDYGGTAFAWSLDPAKVREVIAREITRKGDGDA